MLLTRSPDAKKRKAPPIQNETTQGPSAKKAKPSAESSSSEESSSDDKKKVGKAAKSTPAGSVVIYDKQLTVQFEGFLRININKHAFQCTFCSQGICKGDTSSS